MSSDANSTNANGDAESVDDNTLLLIGVAGGAIVGVIILSLSFILGFKYYKKKTDIVNKYYKQSKQQKPMRKISVTSNSGFSKFENEV